MKTFYTTIEKPEWVQEQENEGRTIIHNAPRPLYGDATNDTWELPYIRGRHYAAISPNSSNLEQYEKLNESQDATMLIWVSKADAFQKGVEFYTVAYRDVLQMVNDEEYREYVINKGIDVMNGFETLES